MPGYSPELNPSEWVWKNVKHDQIAPKLLLAFFGWRGTRNRRIIEPEIGIFGVIANSVAWFPSADDAFKDL